MLYRGVLLAGVFVALTACSSTATSSGSSAPVSASADVFPLVVSVAVFDDGNGSYARLIIETEADELDCEGDGPYSAVTEGASVTVRDASGTTVGLGELGPGADAAGWPNECVFSATIPNIPGSSDFYSVQVADGPEEQVTAAEARAGIQLAYGQVP